MHFSRRQILASAAISIGGMTFLPYDANAASEVVKVKQAKWYG